MRLPISGLKAFASVFATVLGLQSIAYGQPLTETGKIYWTTMTYPHFIKRANLDGSNSERLVTKGPEALGIALNLVGGKVYWTEDYGRIRRADLDGSNVEDLLEGVGAENITLDAERGKMYWASATRIQRADLDGSDAKTLVTAEGDYHRFRSLALDVVEGKMYWISVAEDDPGKIQRADLDGSNVEDLVTAETAHLSFYWSSLSLDVTGGKMYWVAQIGRSHSDTIYRADLDGSNVENLLHPSVSVAGKIAVNVVLIGAFTLDTIGRKIYWEQHFWLHGDYPNVTAHCADLDGSNKERIDFAPPWTSVFDHGSGKLYWTSGYKIRRTNWDGSNCNCFNIEDLEDLVQISIPFSPRGIALDRVGEKMYWTDGGKESIERADLDGSNAEILVAELLDPKGIHIDETGRKMYWTELDRIRRSDLDGSDDEVLVEELSHPYGIEINGLRGEMYWRDRNGVQRADLDGSNAEVLVGTWSSERWIAVDRVEGKIYWTDSGKIRLANLDGSKVETFLPEDEIQGRYAATSPKGLAVDAVGRKLYWSANELFDPYLGYYGLSDIKEADLDDGSNVVTGFGIPEAAGDIALYLPQSIPTLVSTLGTTLKAPATSRLGPNFPNPFNAGTHIAYRLATPGQVRLEIYNVLGQPVRTLVDQVQPAGIHEVHWDARDQQGTALASGVYLTRLHHSGGVHSLRLLFLR